MSIKEILPENSPEKKAPKRLVLDFGGGMNPVPALGRRKIRDDEIYINLDSDFEDLQTAKNIMKDMPNADHYQSVQARGESLPMRDNSIDEVLACNILASERSEVTRPAMLEEIRRVLSPGGTVTMLESYGHDFDVEAMTGELVKYGFHIKKIIQKNSPEWKEAYREFYQFERTILVEDAYIIFASKESDLEKAKEITHD